ncbi:MAG: hypothetical protein WC732_09825 [Candidatus Omnitrophota bacterium]
MTTVYTPKPRAPTTGRNVEDALRRIEDAFGPILPPDSIEGWRKAAFAASVAERVGVLPRLFSGTAVYPPPGPVPMQAIEVSEMIRATLQGILALTLKNVGTSPPLALLQLLAETVIAVQVLADRADADPLDVWMYETDWDALRAALDRIQQFIEALRPTAVPPTPAPMPTPPSPAVVAPTPAPPVPTPLVPLPAPFFPPRPPAPTVAPLAPASPFVAILRALALRDGAAPDAYVWPATRTLSEERLAQLWETLVRLRGWPDADPSQVSDEIRTTFGKPPYFFIKPGAGITWAPLPPSRGRRAVVGTGYRALRPGPNYSHFNPELVDNRGRHYSIGRELTSSEPALYYRRPVLASDRPPDPLPDERVVMRHSQNTRASAACPGHSVVIEWTRIAGVHAATGIVGVQAEWGELLSCTRAPASM